MRYGLSIADLVGADPRWAASLAKIATEDVDAQQIDVFLTQFGLSPEEAAHHLLREGVPYRRLEGLKYLAREREEKIMDALGDSMEGLLADLESGAEVRVHARRMRRVVAEAERRGIETEVVYAIRPVPKEETCSQSPETQ